ncbi:hypothetical protein DAI22_12g107300 [Oryza sativa Japonica Group]|nr:hypothetical protein DAI22_12g107300 [Oryza sativa Japonica Group]
MVLCRRFENHACTCWPADRQNPSHSSGGATRSPSSAGVPRRRKRAASTHPPSPHPQRSQPSGARPLRQCNLFSGPARAPADQPHCATLKIAIYSTILLTVLCFYSEAVHAGDEHVSG